MTKVRMTKSEFLEALEILAEKASTSFDIEVKISSVILFTIGGCLCMGEGFLTPLLEVSTEICRNNLEIAESLTDLSDSIDVYNTTKGH